MPLPVLVFCRLIHPVPAAIYSLAAFFPALCSSLTSNVLRSVRSGSKQSATRQLPVAQPFYASPARPPAYTCQRLCAAYSRLRFSSARAFVNPESR
ncbi:hypothetical protein BJ546DRAFT_995408 [Cryomyces antarcticus]